MISIIPAIKSLKIRNIGPIRKADLRFYKGINIIYSPNASGKTTIINAICHLLKGEKLLYDPNNKKKKSEKSFIEIELLNKKMSTEVKEQSSAFKECLRKGVFPNGESIPWGIHSAEGLEKLKNTLSCGERIFLEAAEAIRMSSKGQAILLDDAFSCLDKDYRNCLFKILNESQRQVIATISHEMSLPTEVPFSISTLKGTKLPFKLKYNKKKTKKHSRKHKKV